MEQCYKTLPKKAFWMKMCKKTSPSIRNKIPSTTASLVMSGVVFSSMLNRYGSQDKAFGELAIKVTQEIARSGKLIQHLFSPAAVCGNTVSHVAYDHTTYVQNTTCKQHIVKAAPDEIINKREYDFGQRKEQKENFVVQHSDHTLSATI